MSLIDKSTLPPILYKYRFWSDEVRTEEKTVLTHNQLYFSKPSKFSMNDEFKLHFEDNIPIERMEMFIRQDMLNKYPNASSKEIQKCVEYWMKNTPFKNKEHIEEVKKYTYELLNEQVGVFCLSPFNDNEALWEGFGDNYQGYCVGFDAKLLTEDENLLGTMGYVQYYPKKQPPLLTLFSLNSEENHENFRKIAFYLPDNVKHEQEFRCTKTYMQNRVVTIPSSAYKEVILGHRMSLENKKEVVAIVNSRFPHAKIFETYDSDGELAIKTYNE